MKYWDEETRTPEEIHRDWVQRLSEPIKPTVVGHRELTDEEKEMGRKFLEEIEQEEAAKKNKTE